MEQKRVLIVEDDFVSGKMLEKILLKMGYYSMGIEASAESTLLRIMTDKPDIIFMDIELSGVMDGIHIAEILSRFCNIPIIFVTGHDDAQTLVRAKDLGFGYIVKPFFERDINEAMKRYIEPEIDTSAQSMQQEKVMVKNGDEILFLDLHSINYFESKGHTVFVHTNDAIYSLRASLSYYEACDKFHYFVRCHKSFLVNISMIEAITSNNGHYQIKIRGCDSHVDLSRNKVKLVKESIKGHIL